MEKRGQISQSVIISIIILLLVAGILFYFFKVMPYKPIVDKQACYQSVLLRSQNILGVNPGQKLQVPLNCKTEEIEINSVDSDFIKREIANAMYDCWWMLGEGERNFFSKTVMGSTHCTVCSRIKFGESTQKKIKEIKDFDLYLQNTKIPKKNLTYMDYFTGGNEFEKIADSPINIDTRKEYAITYSLSEGSSAPEMIAGQAAGVAVGMFFLSKGDAFNAIRIGTAVGFGTNWAGGRLHDWITSKVQGTTYLVAFNLIPLDAESLKGFGCDSIESIP